ncbi:MAG: hypothetical protein GC136_03100 [Alphaproteobacteria bacterium]|nr:hypothetical protein [Alphaproteobacteria bacterium]
MSPFEPDQFNDHPVAVKANGKFTSVMVDVDAVVKSWKKSLFSYEWLTPEGAIKPIDALNDAEMQKRALVEERITKGDKLEKPILGIGMLDNVEIGSGREILLTLAAHGTKKMPVHVPASQVAEFKKFRVDL